MFLFVLGPPVEGRWKRVVPRSRREVGYGPRTQESPLWTPRSVVREDETLWSLNETLEIIDDTRCRETLRK